MENKSLKLKDLITIGVFIIIYFVVMFAVGSIMGLIPILYLFFPTVLGIVAGTVVMLFEAKVPKKGALFIFGMIAPLSMFFMGHTFVVALFSLVVMIVAELIRKSGNYSSLKKDSLSCAIFNLWIVGTLSQMLLVKDDYMELTRRMMSEGYAEAFERLITWPNLLLIALGALIGGYIGAVIGKKLLKKHFEKAGIV